ncbi:MAG: acyl-CoA dehydrogenase family protein [Armatimonadota bacterium]|nr:acyl-CoA dehydrogenase family protein [Armatimonadota bacterium]MDR5702388.1 acyl-CoA dehydrogenase family protein [Armatimonadota bacterium]MDR7435481.1 acyl-CoA dehydrogenase family protein [Armatimonadota bacterium]
MGERTVAGIPAGGSFLIETPEHGEVFTPEDFTEEHKMIAQTVRDFEEQEVLPNLERLEHQDWELTRTLLRKLGDLGLLGIDVPEEYGGSGLDKITSLIVAENMRSASFSVSFGAHVGIGTLPIVFFGNEDQKRRYLPAMARGEKIGAYALTEPTAGSDALAIRTRATLSEDGKFYLLTGTKQFITNAAFADVFITYAKVDGEKFTCFIVDRDTPGFTIGPEEKKMGIKGSSTASLSFEGAKVPVENVLGEVGRGHVVAFNILNMGRFKLGAGCMGASKAMLQEAVSYAKQRVQFGKPICQFGLIQHKLAEMAIRTYMAESMVYRTGGLVQRALEGTQGKGEDVVRALEEYAVECSINKVYASEVLDYVVDEAVQIYGGYGFIEEYPTARAYRDARINRIFEGTNEINRLLIPGMLLRRAQRGRLPLFAAAQKIAEELLAPAPAEVAGEGPLAEERRLVEMAKKATLFASGVAVQKYMEGIEEQQEILGWIADMIMEVYAMESGLLRAFKAISREGEAAANQKIAMVRAYIYDAIPRIEQLGRQVLAATEQGDTLRTQLAGLRRFLRYTPVNTVALRRAIAERVIAAGGYVA